MTRHVNVPVKVVGGSDWGDLSSIARSHEICAEKVRCTDASYSFAGGHRVRLYKFDKNVHWKIPKGTDLDITDVHVTMPPARKQQRK